MSELKVDVRFSDYKNIITSKSVKIYLQLNEYLSTQVHEFQTSLNLKEIFSEYTNDLDENDFKQ